MLSITGDNGTRLAAIIPTLIKYLGVDLSEAASKRVDPQLKSAIVLVVDGLGWHNLFARSGHARTLTKMKSEKIQTVVPSTTAAALATLTTGVLPGQHGLTGYRILHPQFGVISALSEWDQIEDVREWQLHKTLFEVANDFDISSHVVARKSHSDTGFTRAVLGGTKYWGVDSLEQRFDTALEIAGKNPASLTYLYVDELDRAGHKYGWKSNQWIEQLERVDSATERLLQKLSEKMGFVLTADHGMVDIDADRYQVVEEIPQLKDKIIHISGEPRFRHIYLKSAKQADEIAQSLSATQNDLQVSTRDQVIASKLFGELHQKVHQRIGDLVITPNRLISLATQQDPIFPVSMIGQHGGVTSEERDVPILVSGKMEDLSF